MILVIFLKTTQQSRLVQRNVILVKNKKMKDRGLIGNVELHVTFTIIPVDYITATNQIIIKIS